jgi:hypothetical protein
VASYDLFADAAQLEVLQLRLMVDVVCYCCGILQAAAPPLAMVRRHARSIRFGKQSSPMCAAFSPDGQVSARTHARTHTHECAELLALWM